MDTLCHAALVCCILSALAGLVRTFWPQNGFKPVINAVLTLYIITSVLHAVSGLAGMLLLCMSEWLPAGQSTQNAAQSSQQSQTAAEYEQQLETRLAALIRAMDGAGETVVMVTLDCGEETTYAADTRTEKTSEDTRSSAASQRTHLLAGAQPVVQSVQAPQVRGVAVLCQGGGNAGTQRRITELVSALTGVGASHITVNKMQS